MTRRTIGAAGCAAMALLAAEPAAAACSLQAQAIPVTMQGMRPIVTAKVNGQEARFLLDSGSTISALNSALAERLKLKPVGIAETGTRLKVAAKTRIRGVAGVGALNGVVKVDRFDFAGAAFKDTPFMTTDRTGGVDGLLGQALLQGMDVEYDLGGGQVRLARPQGCADANMAYWAKDGQDYSVIPLDWANPDNPHTQASITINGVRMSAVFDTGSPTSLVSEGAAARAGVRTGDPGVIATGRGQGLDAGFDTWVGTFKSVKIGDEEIQNTPLEIAQSDAKFDVLLGADFFLSHHLYVANSQGKIYFTYEGGAPFRVPRPQQAEATR